MSFESSKRNQPLDDEILKYSSLSAKRQAISDRIESTDETQIVTLRGIISGRDAMAIVEESGENITLLQEKTGARIFLTENVLGSIERILTCVGTPKSVAKAFSLVLRLLHNEDLDSVSVSDDKPRRVRLAIPHIFIESLIGKHGSRINEIQKISGARMTASDSLLPLSTERTLVIYGIEDAIYTAIFYVSITLIQQADHITNLQTCLYNPLSMHGGYGYPATFQKVSFNDTMITPGNPYGVAPNAITQQNYQMSNYTPADPQAVAAYNAQQQNQTNSYTTKQQGQSQQSQQQTQQQTQQSSQVTPGQPITQQIFIPNDMVGAIIGKGGTKINEIRQLSGSHIKINEPADNSAERLVTITGTPECNQMALYMLYSRLENEKHRV
ncbi:hypothetical protein PMAC_001672 [Pneumocystis sp. 'macacae']|nr:hypothetical protein PMAC_001672 [Pneumocystis sp. 'macacae']